MTSYSRSFRVGTRPSKLSRVQTEGVLERLRSWWPEATFETVIVSSPGDRDRACDLRDSPPDFFTRDLDEALRTGHVDFALHSAKDLPDPVSDDFDWFWLPWAADRRDALVLRPGVTAGALPPRPRIGTSSARRENYARQRFPQGRCSAVRGNIEERLRQLDEGAFDVLLMAGAALERLDMVDRVTEWIPESELSPPEGQGVLAVTYRMGDQRMNRLRSLFVSAVRFVGAGAGDASHCTLGGRQRLEQADVCLYDRLVDPALLRVLPVGAQPIDVGKRCGDHTHRQQSINRLIADHARRGRRVVRLKGGDPGLFGRLAEEIEQLDRLELAYELLPGVSSLNAATTGTGLLLTRRGVSRGFCALTPRVDGGGLVPVDAASRAGLPIICFMALRAADSLVPALLADGQPPDTPAAVITDAGTERESVCRTTLAELGAVAAQTPLQATGLLVVGEICRYGSRERGGPLRGARVLLTCSDALLDRAAMAVADHDGIPLRHPLLRLNIREEAQETIGNLQAFDWLVLTSPSAVRCFVAAAESVHLDWRCIPRLLVCGPATGAALRAVHLQPEVMPTYDPGGRGLIDAARAHLRPGQRVLRLRSDRAGPGLAESLQSLGAVVTDCVLYHNEPVRMVNCPPFDVAFFASGSAVDYFFNQGFGPRLTDAIVVAIGAPTAAALERNGSAADVMGDPATVFGAVSSLARYRVGEELWH